MKKNQKIKSAKTFPPQAILPGPVCSQAIVRFFCFFTVCRIHNRTETSDAELRVKAGKTMVGGAAAGLLGMLPEAVAHVRQHAVTGPCPGFT